MNRALILMSIVFFTISCSDKDEPDGKWRDNIKLSTKEVNFTSEENSVAITTKGDWWWVAEIVFEDNTYSYYNSEDIDLESDSYSIQEDSFIVERRDKNTLFIKMNKNNTGLERILHITLEAGDYFDYVHIKQEAH